MSVGCLNEHLEAHGVLKIPLKILAMELKSEAINTQLLAQASGLEEGAKRISTAITRLGVGPQTQQLGRVI